MKRLAMAAVLGGSAVIAVAQPAAASWVQQGTPAPLGASTWSLNAVSCTSPFSCMAVGNADSSLLAETRSGSTWTIVAIPDPGGGQLAGISCTAASACESVGSFASGGTTQTLAEAWNGTSWTIQATPNPGGATASSLGDVSCRNATACEAVGQFTSGGTTQTLAEAWNGTSWTIQATPNPGGATTSSLGGVSCPAATACEAVGQSFTGGNSATLAEVWNGTSWVIQTTPNIAGPGSELSGVSCTAATACTAVGFAQAQRWNGTSWTLQAIAKPKGNTAASLSRVSCTAADRCMAVGSFFKQAIETLVAEQWTGTKWAVVSTPLSTANDSSALAGVSCTVSTACTGVGSYHDPVTGNRALAEDWALRWQLQPPAIPSGALASSLDTISCPAVTFCAAVGNAEFSGSVFQPVAERWNGNAWTIDSTPNASNSNLSGVSCSAPKACTAVGDVSSGGSLLTLAERWNGTSWTVQATPSPPGAVHSFLISVSCPAATACTAVGFATDAGGNQTPFAEQWNGTGWTLQTTPFPSGSTTSQLNGVSCMSATACTAVGSDNTQTWAEAWNGTSWTIQATPTPSGGRNPFLHGVSCTAANACTAVGDYVNSLNKVVPLAERWDGTSWTVQAAVAPSGSASGFSSVSCSTTPFSTGCIATGFVTKAGVGLPLAEGWNGSSWSVKATVSPDPNVTRSNLSSVSCSTHITCMVVGFYETSGGVGAPLGEQWS